MRGLLPDVKLEVAVGDTGWIETVIANEDGSIVDLTGCGARYIFWVDGAVPHAVRQAIVIGSQGIIRLKLRGDEYTPAGKLVWRQPQYAQRDFSGSSLGTAYFMTSGTPVGRRVVRTPS